MKCISKCPSSPPRDVWLWKYNSIAALLQDHSHCWPPDLAVCCRTLHLPAQILRSSVIPLCKEGYVTASGQRSITCKEKGLSVNSFWYLQLSSSSRTVVCGQGAGYDFSCSSYLMVSAMFRLLNHISLGTYPQALDRSPPKREVITVSVFSVDRPADSLLKIHVPEHICDFSPSEARK